MNYKERFFKEIEKRLNELGLKTELIKPVHGYDYISIYASSDKEIGIIYEDGGFNLRHQYQNFFNPINKVTKEVKEYIKAYCSNADELDSKGLSKGYKKLLEFNNYVLAMKQMVDERYQFITWVKGANGGVAYGRYFTDYQSAKENMAERCGLIKPKMLNEVELKLIYTNLIYLIKTTPDISYDNEKALGEVLNKIETIVPEIKERQEISEEKEVEPQLEL